MKKFLLLKFFAFAMMFTSNLIAATITVTTTDDEITTNGDCSLREAVYNADDNDDTYPDCDAGSSRSTDEIILDSGVYNLSEGELEFRSADDIIIEGKGAESTVIRGHFYINDTEITLNSLSIKHSSGEIGGAMIIAASTATLNKCKIASNNSSTAAGAIWVVNSELTVNSSTISENQAPIGGGIVAQVSKIVFNQSTLSENESEYDGGGIYLSESELILLNSTISGNISSSLNGGGIFLESSELTTSNSTISENVSESGYGGGIYVGSYSEVTIKSSILSGNTAADKDDNCAGENVTSEGYNFFESLTSTDCDITLQRTDIENSHTNLDLSSLDNNGGSTETHALGSSSMAIDKGSCDSIVDTDGDGTDDTVTKDQRGRKRSGSCDIGAYEVFKLKKNSELEIFKDWGGKLGGAILH